jgi:hypothetical protein
VPTEDNSQPGPALPAWKQTILDSLEVAEKKLFFLAIIVQVMVFGGIARLLDIEPTKASNLILVVVLAGLASWAEMRGIRRWLGVRERLFGVRRFTDGAVTVMAGIALAGAVVVVYLEKKDDEEFRRRHIEAQSQVNPGVPQADPADQAHAAAAIEAIRQYRERAATRAARPAATEPRDLSE